eukprot:SAG31_NODE_2256_length_6072_cov_9.043529_4_plen_49_part_00
MAQQTLLHKLRQLPDSATVAGSGLGDQAILHLRCPVTRTFKISVGSSA